MGFNHRLFISDKLSVLFKYSYLVHYVNQPYHGPYGIENSHQGKKHHPDL